MGAMMALSLVCGAQQQQWWQDGLALCFTQAAHCNLSGLCMNYTGHMSLNTHQLHLMSEQYCAQAWWQPDQT